MSQQLLCRFGRLFAAGPSYQKTHQTNSKEVVSMQNGDIFIELRATLKAENASKVNTEVKVHRMGKIIQKKVSSTIKIVEASAVDIGWRPTDEFSFHRLLSKYIHTCLLK